MQIALFSAAIFLGIAACVSVSLWLLFLPLQRYLLRKRRERVYKEAYENLYQSLYLTLLHAKTLNTVMHTNNLLYPVDGIFSGLEAALKSLSLLPERLPKDD